MTRRRCPRAVWLLLVAACTATPPLPELPTTHPASVGADEAPEPAPSSTLSMPVRKPRPRGETGAVEGHRR